MFLIIIKYQFSSLHLPNEYNQGGFVRMPWGSIRIVLFYALMFRIILRGFITVLILGFRCFYDNVFQLSPSKFLSINNHRLSCIQGLVAYFSQNNKLGENEMSIDLPNCFTISPLL